MEIRYPREIQESIGRAKSHLWREFGLQAEPPLDLQWMQNYQLRTHIEEGGHQLLPSGIMFFLQDALEVRRLGQKAYDDFDFGQLAGKHLHNLVNPSLYAQWTCLDDYATYKGSDGMQKIKELVVPASAMRTLVGAYAGFNYAISGHELSKGKMIACANTLLSCDSAKPESANPTIELAQRQIEATACAVAAAYGELGKLAEIARAPASEYRRYASEALHWLKESFRERN